MCKIFWNFSAFAFCILMSCFTTHSYMKGEDDGSIAVGQKCFRALNDVKNSKLHKIQKYKKAIHNKRSFDATWIKRFRTTAIAAEATGLLSRKQLKVKVPSAFQICSCIVNKLKTLVMRLWGCFLWLFSHQLASLKFLPCLSSDCTISPFFLHKLFESYFLLASSFPLWRRLPDSFSVRRRRTLWASIFTLWARIFALISRIFILSARIFAADFSCKRALVQQST